MFLTLDYYLKKSHLFKKRNKVSKPVKSFATPPKKYTIVSTKTQKFEFVYIRAFKKYFRRSYCKSKMRFFKPKIWIKIFANLILSKKSKNARMGAGVGQLVRLASQLFTNTILI